MRRAAVMRLLLVSVVALSLLLAGCGQVFVGFVSNPGNPMQVSGNVSMAQLQFYDDSHGTLINFTAVTIHQCWNCHYHQLLWRSAKPFSDQPVRTGRLYHWHVLLLPHRCGHFLSSGNYKFCQFAGLRWVF